MPTFIVTTLSTFRHAYLIDAPTAAEAESVFTENSERINEWWQEYQSEHITSTDVVDADTLKTLHEDTLRDKTNWWLPVEKFIATPTDTTHESSAITSTRKSSPREFDLEQDLNQEFRTNPEFTTLVWNEEFMRDLYASLCNREWFNINDTDHTHEWACSWRYAGGLVAEIRNRVAGLNENYMDYFCSGNEGTVSAVVAERLMTLGWTSKEIVVPD